MMEVVLLAAAESDLMEHYLRLEELHEGLGTRLDDDVAEALELLAKNPLIAPPFGGVLRRQLLRRWGLGIFYSMTGRRVLVTRVLDLRQNPKRIRRLLGLL
jgi:plasmid stabilization system protein ParE